VGLAGAGVEDGGGEGGEPTVGAGVGAAFGGAFDGDGEGGVGTEAGAGVGEWAGTWASGEGVGEDFEDRAIVDPTSKIAIRVIKTTLVEAMADTQRETMYLRELCSVLELEERCIYRRKRCFF